MSNELYGHHHNNYSYSKGRSEVTKFCKFKDICFGIYMKLVKNGSWKYKLEYDFQMYASKHNLTIHVLLYLSVDDAFRVIYEKPLDGISHTGYLLSQFIIANHCIVYHDNL